jgi:hypothetical protein
MYCCFYPSAKQNFFEIRLDRPTTEKMTDLPDGQFGWGAMGPNRSGRASLLSRNLFDRGP